MPKMKTHKAIASRIKVTGTGKLLRQKPGHRHKLTKKSSKRKRRLSHQALVCETQLKTYQLLIGV